MGMLTRVGLAETLAFRDLEFPQRPVQAYSRRGVPFTRWVPFGMPRIPPKTLDCVCYLYRTEEDAIAGTEFGGTGFLVSVPSRFPGRGWIYAVTNWHVAVQDGASVLRLNTRDGGVDIIPLEPHEWHFDPRYDIAVAQISIDRSVHKYSLVPAKDGFVMPENVDSAKIGPGDDVFMVGRFVDHDGGPINRPAVRFGNVSVMPSPIEQPDIGMADSYCIDLHSRSGYSGSPVFVFRTPGFDLEEPAATSLNDAKFLFAGVQYLALLGIHFAQFIEEWELTDKTKQVKPRSGSVPLIRDGMYVKGLSGMTCVLPAWTIWDVLNSPKLKMLRDAADDAEQMRRDREGHPPEAEATETTPSDSSPSAGA